MQSQIIFWKIWFSLERGPKRNAHGHAAKSGLWSPRWASALGMRSRYGLFVGPKGLWLYIRQSSDVADVLLARFVLYQSVISTMGRSIYTCVFYYRFLNKKVDVFLIDYFFLRTWSVDRWKWHQKRKMDSRCVLSSDKSIRLFLRRTIKFFTLITTSVYS